eukprot:SAG31_NODE_2998_length_4801_cov_3.226074_6_plen_77_part_00
MKRLFAVPIDLDQRMNDFYREVSLQRDLHHPNVISCYGACDYPQLCIVTECCLTSLHTVLHGAHVRYNKSLSADVF